MGKVAGESQPCSHPPLTSGFDLEPHALFFIPAWRALYIPPLVASSADALRSTGDPHPISASCSQPWPVSFNLSSSSFCLHVLLLICGQLISRNLQISVSMVRAVPKVSGRSWGECFVNLLSHQQFETEYEFLCAEASIQALRAKIWSRFIEESPDEDSANPLRPLLSRHDIKCTVNLALKSVSSLLLKVKAIELKYRSEQVSPSQTFDHGIKRSRSSKAIQTLFLIRSSSFRVRKKQRSLIEVARWAICDRGKLEEKVSRVKGLIDGLEDVLRAAGAVLPRGGYLEPSDNDVILSEETPPPYSSVLPIPSPPISSTPLITAPQTHTAVVSRLSDNSIYDMLEHHAGMKRYLARCPNGGGLVDSRHRSILRKLTTHQFKELRLDVFDELLRRQEGNNTITRSLPEIHSYHPKRNEARKKLSTIGVTKFSQLLFDIVSELERRFPHLKDSTRRSSLSLSTSEPLLHSPSPLQCNYSRRWGCVGPHSMGYTPPPYLKYRAAHQATIQATTTSSSTTRVIETPSQLRL